VGAERLAKMKAIASRLVSIEEMAGMVRKKGVLGLAWV